MWTLPDKGEGDNDLQSIMFQEYLDILVEGIQGKNGVIGTGGGVTGGADMTPAVATVEVISNYIKYTVTGADVTIGAADATNPRFDLIVVNSSGALAVRAGTAAAAPKPPARTANDVVLAVVYVPATDTAIATSQCIDMRVPATGLERTANVLLTSTDIGNKGYVPVIHICRLSADYTLTSTTAEQKLFNCSTNGRLTLETGAYEFECLASISGLSTTTGNGAFDILGAGGATLADVLYHSIGVDGATATAATQTGSTSIQGQSAVSQQTGGTATTWNFRNKGTFEVTVAGTIVPSVTLVTAAAGAVRAGSYFKCWRVGASGADTLIGQWD